MLYIYIASRSTVTGVLSTCRSSVVWDLLGGELNSSSALQSQRPPMPWRLLPTLQSLEI